MKYNLVIFFPFIQTFAGLLAKDAERKGFATEIQDLKDYDPEDNLAEEVIYMVWYMYIE